MTYTALLDANVLYPAVTRDILMRLAVTDIYKARWSNDIHREWIENLLENEPKRERAKLERTRELMDLNVRDALVTGYEPLIPGIVGLPDPGDRHVLAAAIVGRCDVIVTANLRDFPEAAIAPYGIEAIHPDEFLGSHLSLAPGLFCGCVKRIRAQLKNPPMSVEDYLGKLVACGLVATAQALEQYAELI